MNNAQQVYLSKSSVQAWYDGKKVVSLKKLPRFADPAQYRHINVAHDEVIEVRPDIVIIEKHY